MDFELQGPDVLIVRRMRQVLRPKPKLVRRPGGLIAVGGKSVNSDEVKRMIEDEVPDAQQFNHSPMGGNKSISAKEAVI